MIATRLARGKSEKLGGGTIMGTVRHQFSPRWSFEVAMFPFTTLPLLWTRKELIIMFNF